MEEKIQVIIKTIKANAEDIFTKKVIPSGHGAVIPFFKKFIDKTVYVIIRRKKK